jgi:hypothetical protein
MTVIKNLAFGPKSKLIIIGNVYLNKNTFPELKKVFKDEYFFFKKNKNKIIQNRLDILWSKNRI